MGIGTTLSLSTAQGARWDPATSHTTSTVLVSNTGGDTTTANTVTSSTVSGSTYPVVLGGRFQNNRSSFDGLIDEVRIYDTALTATEVQALFIPEPSAGLLAGLAIGISLLRRRRS